MMIKEFNQLIQQKLMRIDQKDLIDKKEEIKCDNIITTQK